MNPDFKMDYLRFVDAGKTARTHEDASTGAVGGVTHGETTPPQAANDENAQGKPARRVAAIPCALRIVKNYELRILWVLRQYQQAAKANARPGFGRKIWKAVLSGYKRKYGIELVCLEVGGGLRMIHPWGITVNSHARIGQNVTLYKGVTIGVIESGPRAGNPTIGDDVTVFANATICGNVHIGDGTVIAPGTLVNFDVPAGATVVGNPGVIHVGHADGAVEQ